MKEGHLLQASSFEGHKRNLRNAEWDDRKPQAKHHGSSAVHGDASKRLRVLVASEERLAVAPPNASRG